VNGAGAVFVMKWTMEAGCTVCGGGVTQIECNVVCTKYHVVVSNYIGD